MKNLYLSIIFLTALISSYAQKYHGQKILGYIPMYSSSNNVDYEKLTHAVFAFIQPDNEGNIPVYKDYQQVYFNAFIDRTEGLDVIRTISIGGQNADLTEMTKSSEYISHFVDTLVKFCKEYEFKAVDLDWEGIQGETVSRQYGELVDSLAHRLHTQQIDLCIAVPFTSFYGDWIPESALQQADWINVMAYDGTGTWNSSPFGNHSSFQHLLDGEAYWRGRGVNKSDMVMGIPFYGRTFTSESGGLAEGISYQEIIARFPLLSDDLNQTPGNNLTFFNGPDLIKKKCQYLIDNEFHGVLVWEMTQDASGHKSLFKHITCTYNDEPCPAPSVCENTDITTGLVADFSLDGHADEANGLGLGTPSIKAEQTYDRNAELNKAYFFEANSSIVFGTHPNLDVEDHSFSMWLNLKQDTSDIQVIFKKWDEDADGSYILYTYDERISIQYLAGTEQEPTQVWFNSSIKLAKNEWYHVVVTHSFENGTGIFLNGLNIFKDETQFVFQKRPTHQLQVGGFNFRGKVDDLKIYNRELTQCDIDELFYNNYANEKIVCENILNEKGCTELSINGTKYKRSGTYYQYFDQGASCDSALTLNLTIHKKPYAITPISQTGDILSTSINDYDYQWIDCLTNTPIEGETSQDLTVEKNGEYAIELTDENCTFTTNCKSITVTGFNNEEAYSSYSLYPNPAKERVFIQGEHIEKVEIYNTLGTLIAQTNSEEIVLNGYKEGIYTVLFNLTNGDSFSKKLIIK